MVNINIKFTNENETVSLEDVKETSTIKEIKGLIENKYPNRVGDKSEFITLAYKEKKLQDEKKLKNAITEIEKEDMETYFQNLKNDKAVIKMLEDTYGMTVEKWIQMQRPVREKVINGPLPSTIELQFAIAFGDSVPQIESGTTHYFNESQGWRANPRFDPFTGNPANAAAWDIRNPDASEPNPFLQGGGSYHNKNARNNRRKHKRKTKRGLTRKSRSIFNDLATLQQDIAKQGVDSLIDLEKKVFDSSSNKLAKLTKSSSRSRTHKSSKTRKGRKGRKGRSLSRHKKRRKRSRSTKRRRNTI